MKCSSRAAGHDQAAIRIPSERRDGTFDLARIPYVDRAQVHAKRWRDGLDAPNWPGPAAMVESRRTAARVTRGAMSLSNSSHFPVMEYSKLLKPVMLPPGRARLST